MSILPQGNVITAALVQKGIWDGVSEHLCILFGKGDM